MSRLSLRSAASSLSNHVLFILVYFSLPMALLAVAFAYQDHELTITRVLRIGFWAVVLGVLLAFFGWHVILAPIRRRSGKD
jgi:hypothetical protein